MKLIYVRPLKLMGFVLTWITEQPEPAIPPVRPIVHP